MGGKPVKTFNDDITDRVGQVVAQQREKHSDKPMGVVFGEDHENTSFPLLLAHNILPAIAAQAGDQPKVLQLEWKNTPQNQADLKKFMDTGDTAARDRLIKTNIDLPDKNDEVRAAWGEVLDSARANHFTVAMYDDPKVSIKTLFNERAKELGVDVRDIPKAEQDRLQQKRVDMANPVMVDDIKKSTPPGAFAVVVTGDDHAAHDNDLPEQLGYSYIRAVDTGTAPGIMPNQNGSALNIRLASPDTTHLQSDTIRDAGIDVAGIILRDAEVPPGLEGDNKKFITALTDKMHEAGGKIDGKDMTGGQTALDESAKMLHGRYTDAQIKSDPYLSGLNDMITASAAAVNKELEKGPQAPVPAPAAPPPAPAAQPVAPRPPQA